MSEIKSEFDPKINWIQCYRLRIEIYAGLQCMHFIDAFTHRGNVYENLLKISYLRKYNLTKSIYNEVGRTSSFLFSYPYIWRKGILHFIVLRTGNLTGKFNLHLTNGYLYSTDLTCYIFFLWYMYSYLTIIDRFPENLIT